MPFALSLSFVALVPACSASDVVPRSIQDPLLAWTSFARAADQNGDGAIARDEWDALVSSLPIGSDGRPSATDLVLVLLDPLLDRDEGLQFAMADLAAFRTDLDSDRSGDIDAAERERALAAAVDAPGEEARRAAGLRLLVPLFLDPADRDGDGLVSSSEWFAEREHLLPSGARNEPLWRERVELLTLSNDPTTSALLSALDLGGDGGCDVDDLFAGFDRLDDDASGSLSANEFLERLAGSPDRSSRATGERTRTRADHCLVAWQRSLEDALALVERTGMPLLVCVNMDGEAASDRLALDSYRDPRFVAGMRGFVPIVLSPDLRQVRDHDDRGRRILDPRFGRIVNQEAIEQEPAVADRYFGGRRVAPRHVGVSPSGEILFDLFLLGDFGPIEDALQRFGQPDRALPDPASLDEDALLDSPDAGCRDEIERRFLDSDPATRVRLAARSLSSSRRTQHPELLRLALRDDDDAVRRQAVWTLAQHPQEAPISFFRHAFHAAHAHRSDRAALIAALEELRRSSPDPLLRAEAGRYLQTFAALELESSAVDRTRYSLALGIAAEEREPGWLRDAEDPNVVDAAFERFLDELGAATRAHPEDAFLWSELARTNLRYAVEVESRGENALFHLHAVEEAAAAALERDPSDAIALACTAVAADHLSDLVPADPVGLGDQAARAVPGLLRDASSELTALTLGALGRQRIRAIDAALTRREPWPREWLADVRSAYSVLLLHPAATDQQRKLYLDFLGRMGATALQEETLAIALRQQPVDGELHALLRIQQLRDRGPEELERRYTDELLPAARAENRASLEWYAGLASLFAAERHRLDRHDDSARDAYRRCIARFARSKELEPSFGGWADHYASLAENGIARLELEAGRELEALAMLESALDRSPGSLDIQDGLSQTLRGTASRLRGELSRRGHRVAAEALRMRILALTPSIDSDP